MKRLAYQAWHAKQRLIEAPHILPVPDGSVDLHWKTSEFDLLVNVPEDDAEPVTFSVDDYGKNSSTGTLDLDHLNRVLIFWLVE